MKRMNPTSFVFRMWHQLVQEWRAQWLLVLAWLAVVAVDCWQSMQDELPEIVMPGFLPGLLALIVIVRSVRTDAPGNTEAGTHVRPLGRGAVWVAKVVFFKVTLLLPWLASDWVQCHGHGYGAAEWLAESAGTALPALSMAVYAALLASWSGPAWRNLLVGMICIALLELATWMWGTVWRGGENVCVLAVGRLILILTLAGAWCQVTLRRRAWVTLTVGCMAALLTTGMGNWNWRARPEMRYEDAKLALYFGERPDGGAQELWQGMHVTGLPADHVASVAAFAPVGEGWPPETAFSAYTRVSRGETDKVQTRRRWMVMAHTRALVPYYSSGELWRGHADDVSAEELKKIVSGAAPGPWRLRLAVQRMKRVTTMPLRVAMSQEQRIALEAGRRLDFQMSERDHDSEMRFLSILRRRIPLLAPAGRQEALRVAGRVPEENFLLLLHSPAIREVNTACEGELRDSSSGGLYHRVNKREGHFHFAHPRAQMDIAGLKFDEWVDGTTLDVWWTEECGVVDLEVSGEELRRAVEGR